MKSVYIEGVSWARDTDIGYEKAFRRVPKMYKMFLKAAEPLMTSVPAGSRVGIVNAYNRVNIDPLLDFEDEMARYGWALVDPQKSAFTISNACAGWLAMQLHLPYLNLTVDGGQESLSEAVAIAEASMRLGQIDYCLVIDGGYCEGHAVLALLLSPQPTTHTLFEMTPQKQGLQIKKVES